MDIDRFVQRYPTLHHMAEVGTWQSIKERGLLSTSAALDHFKINGRQRIDLEATHRPEKVAIGPAGAQIVLRDQKPMPRERIAKALVGGTTPEQWYKFLNGKVFMWAEEERLMRLLGARMYRALEHDVLTIDTAALVGSYKDQISLCRMNSGNTLPYWHERGLADFTSIEAYPVNTRGAPVKNVVEVVVNYAVPDIQKFVIKVRRIKGEQVLSNLPL
ncbi:hypothetical protein ASE11_22500 [Hydrogenophaga sp. Root209]|uniref:DUF7002 family protein n=1 Tax=Hydrogenophaga sp. Root209 TaxID=1736490 RepID=UPI0006FF865D|nr:hypothetical protein [Hydrogenophaga sp. Root209]KRC08544.1 hypothetical protein ASE11_22500 [Hydrogenophaga sp. Root209]